MQGAARPGLLVDLQQDGNDAAEPDHFAVRRSLSSNSVSLCPLRPQDRRLSLVSVLEMLDAQVGF